MAGPGKFPEDESRGVYRAIHERRDVRSGFLPEPLGDEVLGRLLEAAHHAPSVGLMQPWRFILIRSLEIRRVVHGIFLRSNQSALGTYEADRAEGVGVGWVSVLDKDALKKALNIPTNVVPVAYLCLGYVDHFAAEPDLERAGWERRIPLDHVLGLEQYDPRWSAEENKS